MWELNREKQAADKTPAAGAVTGGRGGTQVTTDGRTRARRPVAHPVRVNTSAIADIVSSVITTRIARRRAGVSHSMADAAASVAISVCIHRRCTVPGILRMAFAISWRPRRSAIRIVAEFAPLVDFNRRVRNPAGTSSTERYTWSVPLADISTVEV